MESNASENRTLVSDKILGQSIPGLIELSDTLSKTLNTTESAVFKLNTVSLIESVLSEFSFTNSYTKAMRDASKEYQGILVNAQVQLSLNLKLNFYYSYFLLSILVY